MYIFNSFLFSCMSGCGSVYGTSHNTKLPLGITLPEANLGLGSCLGRFLFLVVVNVKEKLLLNFIIDAQFNI
jgi:hypothetical protein